MKLKARVKKCPVFFIVIFRFCALLGLMEPQPQSFCLLEGPEYIFLLPKWWQVSSSQSATKPKPICRSDHDLNLKSFHSLQEAWEQRASPWCNKFTSELLARSDAYICWDEIRCQADYLSVGANKPHSTLPLVASQRPEVNYKYSNIFYVWRLLIRGSLRAATGGEGGKKTDAEVQESWCEAKAQQVGEGKGWRDV